MAGKGLHKSLLVAQSCYYYLVPKLLYARSPPRAESSQSSAVLSVGQSVCIGLHLPGRARQKWINTSEITLPKLLCGLKFRARGEKGHAQLKQQMTATAGLRSGQPPPVRFLGLGQTLPSHTCPQPSFLCLIPHPSSSHLASHPQWSLSPSGCWPCTGHYRQDQDPVRSSCCLGSSPHR